MFSGQGSQSYQMSRDLFEKEPVFNEWMKKGDALLQDLTGLSVIEHIYNDQFKKSDVFDSLLLTHPAIFLVEYVLAQTVLNRGIEPDYVLGTSMGEFASAAFAGVLSYEDGLTAVVKQAQLIDKLCPAGGMIAILDDPTLFEKYPILYENSTLAGVNFSNHFVVTALQNELTKIEQFLREKEISYQTLPVRVPFHSNGIDNAAQDYKTFLASKRYSSPQIPFISCARSQMMETIPEGYFWEIVRSPIEMQKTVHYCQSLGDFFYLDLGPSGTLATFVKYNKTEAPQLESFAILTPFGQDMKGLERLEQRLKES